MVLMNRAAQATTPTQAPLQVSTLPLPGDVRVRILMQPRAALGMIDVQIGLGQGSKGRGERVGDDAAMHVALVRRLACHLQQYARDFEQAACEEEPTGWWERLTAAVALLDPLPSMPDTAGHGWAMELAAACAQEPRTESASAPQRPCASCGSLSPWDACAACVPL